MVILFFSFFHPYLGKLPILTSIFSKGVGAQPPTSHPLGIDNMARPDVISFSTTMDGFPWKKSMLLLDEMKVRDPTTHCPMLDQ